MPPRDIDKGLALRRQLRSAPIPSRSSTDPLRLRQILMNLIGNAIKFTDQGEIRAVAWRCDRTPTASR